MKTIQKISRTGNPVEFGLSLVAGLGLLLMMGALGWGVIGGASADSSAVGMLFIVGLAIFIVGAVAWYGVAQPQKHFDDINVPMDTGHHGADEQHADHAIVSHEPTDVVHH